MTTATLKKYRTYLTDENGKPVMVQLDLRNKKIREAYEAIVQKLEDEADLEIIENYKKEANHEYVDFFETIDKHLADKKQVANI